MFRSHRSLSLDLIVPPESSPLCKHCYTHYMQCFIMICGSAHTFSQARNAESWVEGGVGLVLTTCEKFTRHSTVECHIAAFYFQAVVPLPCNFSVTPCARARTCTRPHAVTSVWTPPVAVNASQTNRCCWIIRCAADAHCRSVYFSFW